VLKGRKARDVYPEPSAEPFMRARDQAFRSGQPLFLPELPLRLDTYGCERFFNFVLHPMRGASGEVEGLLSLSFEVTAQVLTRRRTEALAQELARKSQAASESAQSYRDLLESLPQLVWVEDARGHIQLSNRRWLEYAGLPPRPPPASFCERVHPDDLEDARQRQAASRGRNVPWETESRLRRHDGVYRWFLLHGLPKRDAQGRFSGMVMTATDIDELHRRRESERYLADASRLFSSSLDIEEALRGVVRLAIPRLGDAATLELLEEDGQARMGVVAHVDPAIEARAARLYRRQLSTGHGTVTEVEVLRQGKPLLVNDVAAELGRGALPDAFLRRAIGVLGVRAWLCVPLLHTGRLLGVLNLAFTAPGRTYTSEDVCLAGELAQRAAVAVDNARLYAEARRAILLRDEFLSIASHELRTPLTPLQLSLGKLHREAARAPDGAVSTERLEAMLAVTERQVSRLRHLVEDLLDVSRIESAQLAPVLRQVSLVELTKQVLQALEPQARRAGSTLTLAVDGGPHVGHWDPRQLEQVLTNLVTNAIKYGRGRPIHLDVRGEGGWAQVSVSDEGIGISAQDQKRLFQRYGRAVSPRHYGGLGLGLYIARGLVEAHGGRIHVQSAPDKGTTFTVLLPLQPTLPLASDVHVH
jgi:PAS domain S-box-containing protein